MAKLKSKLTIGISTCLLGKNVRYDGGHKKHPYITDILARYIKFIPVCPELECGMGVPRESAQLEGDPDSPRVIGHLTKTDYTGLIKRFSKEKVKEKKLAPISGFILKSKSPSCSMERSDVYVAPGMIRKKGVGIFTKVLMDRFPDLPVEDEGRLKDQAIRENFIVRIFAYHRMQKLFSGRLKRNDLIEFHSSHKYLLLAHSPKHYRQIEKLVADITNIPVIKFKKQYRKSFMDALRYKATIRKNVNVLQHIASLLRNHLTDVELISVKTSIEDYHKELIPLIAPITLIKHFVDFHDIESIKNQVYLNPDPKELMHRNHA